MKQNLIIALLSVCATLLAVEAFRGPELKLPVAEGQAVGEGTGGIIMATGLNSSGSNQVLYIYNVGTQRLAVYTTKTRGVDFLGVRSISADMSVDYLVPRNPSMTPAEVKEMIDKAKR